MNYLLSMTQPYTKSNNKSPPENKNLQGNLSNHLHHLMENIFLQDNNNMLLNHFLKRFLFRTLCNMTFHCSQRKYHLGIFYTWMPHNNQYRTQLGNSCMNYNLLEHIVQVDIYNIDYHIDNGPQRMRLIFLTEMDNYELN